MLLINSFDFVILLLKWTIILFQEKFKVKVELIYGRWLLWYQDIDKMLLFFVFSWWISNEAREAYMDKSTVIRANVWYVLAECMSESYHAVKVTKFWSRYAK